MKAMQSLGLSKSKQKGFTLVEIAIVLVIIGLLLGGVLKGQSLINSARVRNMADQNSAVQAAYYGFIDRYRAVPGDMSGLNACNSIGQTQLNVPCPPGVGGNANGRLDDGSIAQGIVEAAAVWKHLTAANFMVGTYAGQGAYVVTTVAPANVYGSAVLLGRTNQYLGNATIRLGFFTGRDVPVNIVSELDTKVDDGRPATGVLRGVIAAGTDYGAETQQLATCIVGAGAAAFWDVSIDAQDCNAIYLY